MNNESKSIFASKTFWGALLSVAPMLLPALGVAAPLTQTLIQIGGAALAVYGRTAADSPVHIIPPSDDKKPDFS